MAQMHFIIQINIVYNLQNKTVAESEPETFAALDKASTDFCDFVFTACFLRPTRVTAVCLHAT